VRLDEGIPIEPHGESFDDLPRASDRRTHIYLAVFSLLRPVIHTKKI
jgi:hypothetical protein